MLEKAVEQRLKRGAESAGCMCIKLAPTIAGLPDRLVVLPGGRVVWVELKTDTGRVRKVQERMHARLRAKGHDVRILYGTDDVADFLEELDHEIQSV
jgi:hypothetical protein